MKEGHDEHETRDLQSDTRERHESEAATVMPRGNGIKINAYEYKLKGRKREYMEIDTAEDPDKEKAGNQETGAVTKSLKRR